MWFRPRGLCFVFSSMRLYVCLCRQLPQKMYIFFFCGCPWHADDNHLEYGCLPVRRMCGCYKFFCIPVCPWQLACKGGHPMLVWYRCSAHMGNWSICLCMDRNPLFYKPADSATCIGCGQRNNPNTPSCALPGIQGPRPYQL